VDFIAYQTDAIEGSAGVSAITDLCCNIRKFYSQFNNVLHCICAWEICSRYVNFAQLHEDWRHTAYVPALLYGVETMVTEKCRLA